MRVIACMEAMCAFFTVLDNKDHYYCLADGVLNSDLMVFQNFLAEVTRYKEIERCHTM